MMITNLFILGATEWTGMGLTATDWIAVLTLVGTLIGTLIKLIRVIDKLSNQLDDLHEANENLNQQYQQISEHLQRHDRQFIKDEMKLEEIRKEIVRSESNDGKD